MSPSPSPSPREKESLSDWIIRIGLENRPAILLGATLLLLLGLSHAPFDWHLPLIPRSPVATDAIPDIGENQQIVFSEWPGRSPQDVENQVTFPLTASLLGIGGIKTIRSYSMFGFSTLFIIFQDKVDFYWARARILEKLSGLGGDKLPSGVKPALGPDATSLGQVFWYTLEGRDKTGKPTGGWDLDELRSIQDWQVRYALLSSGGVSEVAGIGGFVREYQVDVDPQALRAFNIPLEEVTRAVQSSNRDVGARTLEINGVEYLIRGVGLIRSLGDIEETVITARDNIPVKIKEVATVTLGPALRTGALDKGGTEAVGGVVVTRFGENPLETIKNVKKKIAEIALALPRKVLPDGRESQVTIIPFYDRTQLIHETLATLNSNITQQVLVTLLVVLTAGLPLWSSLLIGSTLPLSILFCFSLMKTFGVEANIVALSGIAIAIGTVVDMGIILTDNLIRHLDSAPEGENPLTTIHRAATEVGGAILTAITNTIIGFLPVFALEAAEGKLFKPLALTKTFCLIGSILFALTIIPPLATLFFRGKKLPDSPVLKGLVILLAIWGLTLNWHPLGWENGLIKNLLFVSFFIFLGAMSFRLYESIYPKLLSWCLENKGKFVWFPPLVTIWGLVVWLGFARVFFFIPQPLMTTPIFVSLNHAFPGLGKEFMPSLDEGSYLFMPSLLPHSANQEGLDVLQKQDRAIANIAEVKGVVGKIGRVDSPLDPAPFSMIETLVSYHDEFLLSDNGEPRLFRYDPLAVGSWKNHHGNELPASDGKPYLVRGVFARDSLGNLIEDPQGHPFRLWRPALDPSLNPNRPPFAGVRNSRDIWDLIVKAAEIPGVTGSPMLQPINTRIVMLQSGMRSAMGVKVRGPTLEAIEKGGLEIEKFLREIPNIEPASVFAERAIGKPYLEIHILREPLARYGISVEQFQKTIETAIGGEAIATIIDGRERYPIRVRYQREFRDSLETLENILVPGMMGQQIPLKEVAAIRFVKGPQMVRSEDTRLTSYVTFDKRHGTTEVEVVEMAEGYLRAKISAGLLQLPPGVSFAFAGSYENQVRSQKRLMVLVPLVLVIIFFLIYQEFNSVLVTGMVFSSILTCWAGGFILIWFYGQSWFLNFDIFGFNLREFLHIHPINLSVAVWVGFLALFGIAEDDGVIMATHLEGKFRTEPPADIADIRQRVLEGAGNRIKGCLMTSSTTILSLFMILASSGRGSDIMLPMAIPSVGGMMIEIFSVLIIPTLYCFYQEWLHHRRLKA